MKTSNVLFIAVVIIGIGISFSLYYSTMLESRKEYEFAILKLRTEKDLFMATSKESPFGLDNRFGKLNYYPPSVEYKTTGELTLIQDSIPRFMAMSKSKPSRFVRQGYIDFKLKGLTCRLYVYMQPTDEQYPQKLFVPFTDMSNGKGTYQGGRYLDIEIPDKATTKVELDFNLAYNPYCVYNTDYNCPIPPSKNHLNLAIEAGEKQFGK
jgi:uncharacterized protein